MPYIGEYVEIDRNKLTTSLYGGNIHLENSKIKATALDKLQLPLKVVYG